MSEVETDIPKGYWRDANGNLIPTSKIKDVDKARHARVMELCEGALKASADLLAFKLNAMAAVQEFVDLSASEYDVKLGGAKGNVTLVSFDGRFKVIRQMQENIVFDERLQAAKHLIDECIHAWSKGSNANIKALVNHAFQVDKAGNVSAGRVLGLRALKIEDEKWRNAMDAIADATKVASTKPYIRFYQRASNGEYVPIALDVAAL